MSLQYTAVHLSAIGLDLPEEIVTTSALEAPLRPVLDALGLQAGLIEGMTGIAARRFWPRGASLVEAATRAAQEALDQAQILPGDLGALVYGGVCRDAVEPSTACLIGARLGLSPDAVVQDVGNACLGMLDGLIAIANRIQLGQIRCGLVVGCESAREIVEETTARLTQRPPSREALFPALATYTGGSGAAAILVTDGTMGRAPHHRLLGGCSAAASPTPTTCASGSSFTSPPTGRCTSIGPWRAGTSRAWSILTGLRSRRSWARRFPLSACGTPTPC